MGEIKDFAGDRKRENLFNGRAIRRVAQSPKKEELVQVKGG